MAVHGMLRHPASVNAADLFNKDTYAVVRQMFLHLLSALSAAGVETAPRDSYTGVFD